ncbi:tektin bundle-interacting protein 1 [Eublepharis macularius]|uniref:Tektin bundle-interacting protein 1 n=1 Tax=Eublepharis macularius TaxID=481883 RepID=A0AA97JGI1_EUBMA|nr:tektin bundle-interacting protein 1 [Eublepharis macularius]
MDCLGLDYRDLVLDRPYVPQSTLESDFPTPLYSDEYLALKAPRNAPVIKEAVRWKFTPMGWDAIPQTWYTGLTNCPYREAWYTLTDGVGREAYHRWCKSHAKRKKTLPAAYDQHLRESSWYDPTVPAQYLKPATRWGAFLWQDKPVPGKEYVVNRNCSAKELPGKPGYVPSLSLYTPVFTAKDYRTWRMFSHQPSTNNQ